MSTTVTSYAEELLTRLENDYPLQRELDAFFRHRWEKVSGVTEWRKSFNADLLKAEEANGDLIEQLNTLKDAAQELCEAIERDRPAKASARTWLMIDAKRKELLPLLK